MRSTAACVSQPDRLQTQYIIYSNHWTCFWFYSLLIERPVWFLLASFKVKVATFHLAGQEVTQMVSDVVIVLIALVGWWVVILYVACVLSVAVLPCGSFCTSRHAQPCWSHCLIINPLLQGCPWRDLSCLTACVGSCLAVLVGSCLTGLVGSC